MGKLTLMNGNAEVQPSGLVTHRQCEPPEQCLFRGRDEVGREGWFLRLQVTGMYARRVGPFRTREAAIRVLDAFLNKVMEGILAIFNEIDTPKQVILMEGIPQLIATTTGADDERGA